MHAQMHCVTHLLEAQCLLDVLHSLCIQTACSNGLSCEASGHWLSKTCCSGGAEEHAGVLVRGTVPGFQPGLRCH